MATSRQLDDTADIPDRLRKLAAYFSACIDLRNSIALQKDDEQFAREDRGSIRYVLDSNLVRFFLDPVRESDAVNPFSDRERAPYRKLAIITAEFIFSREMEGQWGVPAAISPEHMAELASHMDRLSRSLQSRADELESHTKDDSGFQDEAIRLAQSAGDIGPSVDAFNAARTSTALRSDDAMLRELREAQMLDRLRRQDLLLPMHLDENATREVLEPPKLAVRSWFERIRDQRREAGTPERRAKQDEADAETAEQIVQLNRNVADGALTPTRYVLLTLDRHLFNAAVKWWETEGRQELDFFPFRRLSQYIPFLNTERLPNSLGATQVRNDLQVAFDSLLGMGNRRRHRIPLYIPEPTISPPEKSLAGEVFTPLRWISDQWDGVEPIQAMIIKLWREMTERVVYLNPELLSRRDEAFDNFSEFMANSPNTRQAAVAYLRRAVEKLDKFNIELSIAHSIAGEIVKRPPMQEAHAVRGMPVLRETFNSVLDGQQLYPLLDRVVLEQEIGPLSSIVRRIDESDLWRSAFFAGCVAFWVGQWDGAAVYAARALSSATADGVMERRAELTYFRALTARFAALDMPSHTNLSYERALDRISGELRRMEPHVEEMMKAAADSDAFAECRARVERALWNLTIAYVRGFRNEAGNQDIQERVAQALSELNSQADVIHQLGDCGAPEEALKTMQIEYLIAMAGALIFQERLSGELLDHATKEEIAGRIEEWVAANPGIAPSFYTVTLPLLRNDPKVADAIGMILEEGHQMTWFDQRALAEMRDLTQHATKPPPREKWYLRP